MKYFTVASICIVVVLFITMAKEIEMKSLERTKIQDGHFRTIIDPMTDLKGINWNIWIYIIWIYIILQWYFQCHLELFIALFSDEQKSEETMRIIVTPCEDTETNGQCWDNLCDYSYYKRNCKKTCKLCWEGISVIL